jgi:hypothetical protein
MTVRQAVQQMTSFLEGIKSTVTGKIVLVGPHRVVPVAFNAAPLRREDADVLTLLNTPPAQTPAAQPPAQPPDSANDSQRPLTNAQIQRQLNQFLLANGALLRIPGSDKADELVMLGGHLDSWHASTGARTTRSRAGGGTDSSSFNAAGLPGINMLLDEIQYDTHTWHTNLDTYERIVENDVNQAAIVVAATVYHLAVRDELLPRFSTDEMPRPPAPAPSAVAPAAQSN